MVVLAATPSEKTHGYGSAQAFALLLLPAYPATKTLDVQYWQAKRGSSVTQGSNQRFDASTPAKIGMTLLCTFVFLLAFLIPFLHLIYWTALNFRQDFDARYIDFVPNSLMFAGLTTLSIAFLAVIIA